MSSNITYNKGFLLIGTAVTPLHPGSGRGLGVVDLTIQRDPLGYPILFASSVKGALKSMCIRKKMAGAGSGSCIDENGLAKCGDEKCNKEIGKCCCLFGSEIGGEESQQALVNVLDLVLLALPVPSIEKGYVYVSTPVLLRKTSLIAEALGYEEVAEALKHLANSLKSVGSATSIEAVAAPSIVGNASKIDIAGSTINVKPLSSADNYVNVLSELSSKLGGLAENFVDKLVIVPNEIGPIIIDRAILRVTRIRVRRDRKTVAERSLWTEEYIPSGAIFLGGLIVNPTNNKICVGIGLDVNKADYNELFKQVTDVLKEVLGNEMMFYFIVGGKETVGKGLVKTYIYVKDGGK